MKSCSQKIFPVFALTLYVLGSSLIELSHHDETALLLRSHPVLVSHDCGSHEIHFPIENARHCLACSAFAQRASTEAQQFFVANSASVYIVPRIFCVENPLDMDIHSSGTRGPPSYSA